MGVVNLRTLKGRNTLSHLVRIAALLATFVAAGCISNADVAQTSPAAETEPTSLYSEMHAAIPSARTESNFFDYN